MKTKNNFLIWLSGFSDGEAWFGLCVQTKYRKPHYQPAFVLALRDDDEPVLIHIRDILGFGRLYKRPKVAASLNPNTGEAYMANPQTSYRVDTIKDCLKLIEIFTKYPLRSKKQKVFEVWAKAVRECAKGRYRNNKLLECYRIEMQELRKYKVNPSDLNVVSKVEEFLRDNRQLNFFGTEEKGGVI